MDDVAILIAAAGAASRMDGRDKLLEAVDAEALLLRQVRAALENNAPVMVTLPLDRPLRRAALSGMRQPRLRLFDLADASEGLAASLRAGAAWATEIKARALMIMLADMPEIGVDNIATMRRAARPDRVLRAVDQDGLPGHPVIIPAPLFPALGRLKGDQGAREILRAEDVRPVPLPGHRATTDLDTPEEWAAWRKKTGR